MAKSSGGGGNGGRTGGGGDAPPAPIDMTGKSQGNMGGNPISGSFTPGENVKITVEGTSWKDKRMHDSLKDGGFEFNKRAETWTLGISKAMTKDEVMGPIKKLPNRASEIKIKVASDPGSAKVDRW